MRVPSTLVALSSGLAVAIAALSAASCGTTSASATTAVRQVTFYTGPPGGAYSPLGKALADVYNKTIPQAHVTVFSNDGPRGAGINAEAIEAGKADLGFSRSDIAYDAFRSGTEGDEKPNTHLRAMAVLYTNAVHVIVRRSSGIQNWHDVVGKRVQLTEEAGAPLARIVLEGHGVPLRDVQIVPNARNAITRLKNGEMDVRIFASAYPLATIDDVSETSELKLMSIDPAAVDRLRSNYPFFKPAVIPANTYRGQTEDIRTVGIDGLLLCHDSMPEALVYEMTRQLFEALPELSSAQPAARLINVGRAPSTPVPLHPGAARYYRERDLFR